MTPAIDPGPDGAHAAPHLRAALFSVPDAARLLPQDPPAEAVPEYVARDTTGITRIGHTPARFAQRYPTPVVIDLAARPLMRPPRPR